MPDGKPRILTRIDDAADPGIAGYRNIRERDLVGREGRFVAEGTVVLRMLVDSHVTGGAFEVESLLLLENRVAGLEEILGRLPANIPVFVAAREVMNAVAGFDIHRGVLALGRRKPAPAMEDVISKLPANALVVAACGIANHDNIGGIFRNAAAFGADAVLMDETCCDPLYRKALRVSVGSVLRLPHARSGTIAAMLAALTRAGFDIWGLSPSGASDIREVMPGPRVALLTGTEGEGLPAEVLEAVKTLRIPQAAGLDSLNAGTATGVALYAIASAMKRI